MKQVALAAIALCSAMAGFVTLSLAMDRHYEDSAGRGQSPGKKRPWLRVGGAVGLVASLAASLVLQGSAQGWVLWLGVLTASALAVVLLLTYAPRRAIALGVAACALTLLALLAFAGG